MGGDGFDSCSPWRGQLRSLREVCLGNWDVDGNYGHVFKFSPEIRYKMNYENIIHCALNLFLY